MEKALQCAISTGIFYGGADERIAETDRATQGLDEKRLSEALERNPRTISLGRHGQWRSLCDLRVAIW